MSLRLLLPAIAFGISLAACAVPASAESLADHLVEDQQRINEGIRLGQFTPPERNELQARHDRIEGDRRRQLSIGGGRFPPGQYEQLVARQEALSKTIYDYRHNGRTPTAH